VSSRSEASGFVFDYAGQGRQLIKIAPDLRHPASPLATQDMEEKNISNLELRIFNFGIENPGKIPLWERLEPR